MIFLCLIYLHSSESFFLSFDHHRDKTVGGECSCGCNQPSPSQRCQTFCSPNHCSSTPDQSLYNGTLEYENKKI
uniref:Uncharacterized protein n=1 Tax=Heterorhabditis bacteriophora TaxID=37862 RepID=A0A1I7WYR6_HETBA